MKASDFKTGDVVRLDGVVHYLSDQYVHIQVGTESLLVKPENVTFIRAKIEPGMLVEYRLMTCTVVAVSGDEAWLKGPMDPMIAKLIDVVPVPDPDFDEVEPAPETLPETPPDIPLSPEALAGAEIAYEAAAEYEPGDRPDPFKVS